MTRNSTHPPSTTLSRERTSVTFWGVRGSLAAPGEATRRIGGNTSCVELRSGATSLIFDAGTGLRACGEALVREPARDLHLLLSHLHWDHIQGFPFFVPAYVPGTQLVVHGPCAQDTLRETLETQMRAPNFPVRFADLRSHVELRGTQAGVTQHLGDFAVRAALLNHPGGVFAYRIESSDAVVVYSTDHEHGSAADERLVELAKGADVLIYDAMYTPEEYRGEAGPSRVGWGHSTFEEAARVATAAGVRQLVLFHHDPSRSDDQVDALVSRARALFPSTIAAREGLRLLPGAGDQSEAVLHARVA
ncbi:MAG: MBL fold metallo-hydrolase [Sandaracinaceae bacterium]|nr:MBL fold metallo-hydrolase [Sandaracinaceae bacterium]MBK6811809.1 MBL fold metallo-hydrolase [Sandaracinaceae bacterium]MBK8409404.1 MBL fold metallo-hydrolase [Sandaracinaceae bacterium]